MPHIDYPAFSLDPIQDVIKAARAGALRNDVPLAAKCAWEITGMGLGATLGEPAEHPHAFGAAAEEASTEDLAECREALASVDTAVFGAAAEDAEAIDPVTIMLIQLAIQMITKWIEKRRNP